MRIKTFNFLPILLLLFLGLLQYHLWLEPGGMIDMFRMKKQLTGQMQENAKLKQRNDKLIQQIQYLQASNEAVESRARGELGMIKKGETFYQVVK